MSNIHAVLQQEYNKGYKKGKTDAFKEIAYSEDVNKELF